jgi:hypothetical protein
MGVPPSHPPRGSLPAGFFRPGRGRARRRRPSCRLRGSSNTSRVHAARARGAAIIDGIVGQRIFRTCSPASRRRRCRAAPPRAASAWTPAARALRATGNCPTMPDLDPATRTAAVSVSGSPRQRSGAVRSVSRRRVSLPAGPQEQTRTVGRGSHPERAGAERRTCGACGAG